MRVLSLVQGAGEVVGADPRGARGQMYHRQAHAAHGGDGDLEPGGDVGVGEEGVGGHRVGVFCGSGGRTWVNP